MSDRMQALLSRAVEDQLSEQRQVYGVLAELRNQLAALSQHLDSGGRDDGEPPARESHVAAVGADVRDAGRLIGERIDTLTRLVQGLNRLVDERGSDLAELKTLVGDLRSALAQQSQAIASVAAGSGGASIDSVDALAGQLDALQQRSEALDTSLRELRSAFAGVTARVAELPGRGEVEGAWHTATEPLASLDARVGRLEQSQAESLARLDGLQAAITAGEQRTLAHVDEAVLALAEALLRRRSAPPQDLPPEDVPAGADGEAPAPVVPPDAAPESAKRKPWWRPSD